MLIAILAAIILIFGTWLKVDQEFFWKITAILSIFAVAIAHLLALLSVQLSQHKWLRITTAISVFALATLLAFIIITEFELPTRLIATLAIIVALETLVIPILGRLQKVDAQKTETLVLTQRADGTFQSSNGQIYQVTKISNNPYT